MHSKEHPIDHTNKHDFCDKDWEDNDHHIGCVEDVLEAILHAQKKVKKHHDCDTSCRKSIDELLGEKKKSKKNTIPFILFCGDCEPFKGTGVTTFRSHSDKEKFACVTSFIFKVKKIKHGCAVLELLTFKPEKSHSKDAEKHGKCNGECNPCDQIHCKEVEDLVKTGICITVDLSCFCAITCLPPVCL